MPDPSWTSLLATSRDALGPRLERIADSGALMATQRPPFHPGDVVAAAGRTLAEAASVLGAQALSAHRRGLLSLIPAACAGVYPAAPGRVPTVVGLLLLRVLCLDTTAAWPADCQTWPAALARRQPAAEPYPRMQAAWAALALGDAGAVRELVALPPADAKAVPQPKDPTTLLAHVLAAPADAAGSARMHQLWQGFLRDFPTLLASGVCDWRLLQTIGRYVHRRVGDGETVAWIHAGISAVAAAEGSP